MDASDIAKLDRIEAKLDAALEMLARHDRVLYGNGKPGLIIDVDRLRESTKRNRKLIMLYFTGIGVPIMDILYRTLGHVVK